MTIDDRITAEIRCRSCNHVWIAFAQIQPIIAKRKKDRRQAERDIRWQAKNLPPCKAAAANRQPPT